MRMPGGMGMAARLIWAAVLILSGAACPRRAASSSLEDGFKSLRDAVRRKGPAGMPVAAKPGGVPEIEGRPIPLQPGEPPGLSPQAAPQGRLLVEYDGGARKAIEEIALKRRAFYARHGYGPRYLEETDARWAAEGSQASHFVSVRPDGLLVGANKLTGNPFQPFQIRAYNLDDGDALRVIVSGATIDGEPAAIFHCLDLNAEEIARITVTPFDSRLEKLARRPAQSNRSR